MAEPAQRLSQIPGYYKQTRLADLVEVKDPIPYSELEEGMLIRCTTRYDGVEHASLKYIARTSDHVAYGIQMDPLFSHTGYGACWVGKNTPDWTLEPVEKESARAALLEHMRKYKPSLSLEIELERLDPDLLREYEGRPEPAPKLRLVG